MIFIALFVLIVLGIIVFPMLIPYLLSSYMAIDGIANRQFMYNLKVSVGGVNIFFPDLLYAAAMFLAVLGMLRVIVTGRLQRYAPLTKAILFLVFCYLALFIGKLIHGYFELVPLDSMLRRFMFETQFVYLFVPLIYLRQERTLKKILYFVVAVTLLVPLVQPFLYGSADQVALAKGQGGTLRLGFGNANLLLMLGILAFFVWERKMWLSALPLAGVAMLAQRSAFISVTLSIIALSFLKKKRMKYIALIGVAGTLLVMALFLIQAKSTVPVADKAAERLSQTFQKTGTTSARMAVISMAFDEFGKHPLIGFSYLDIYKLIQKEDSDAKAFNMLHPHNFVLSSLLRAGTIGTVLLFSIIFLVFVAVFRLYREQDTKEQGMYLFSTALFFVVFGLMNTSFTSAGYVFWVLVGIIMWYINQAHSLKHGLK